MKIDATLKWSATSILIFGTAINTAFPELFPMGPLILIVGGMLWLIVSCMWKEWALIVTNAVIVAVGVLGLTYHYL